IAILKALNPIFVESFPSGSVLKSGQGAGTKDLRDFPNLFRVSLLAQEASPEMSYEQDEVAQIECNIDDQTAEKTAWALERCFEYGALDVWQEVVYGKKNRLATKLTV